MTTNLELHYHKKMKKTQHILISGRVQGVNFRKYTKSCAEKLKLVGWVRNLEDGRVEALVHGEAEHLELLTKLLLRGSVSASVSGIAAQFVHYEPEYKQELVGFEIVADGGEPCANKILKI